MAFLSSASKATKITLGTVAGLTVLVGLVPYLITWNEYKNLITDKVSAELGRDMDINGNIRFSILPRPEAHISQIIIKNPAGTTSENFLQLEQLDVAVALWPLLRKEIEIEKITLVKPAITLEKTANGGNNWTFESTTPKDETQKETASDNASGTSLKINDISLEDAYIRYVDTPNKSVQTVGPINANLSLESLKGPYNATGTLTYNKMPLAFDAKVGASDSDTASMPIQANLGLDNKNLTVDFKGQIKTGDAMAVSGDILAQSKNLSSVLSALSADGKKSNLPAAVNRFDLKSQILYSNNKIALPGLQIKGDGLDIIADTVITTGNRMSVTSDIGRFVVPASLVGGDNKAASSNSKNNEPLAVTLENGFKSAQSILDIALPTAPLDVIITADAITLPNQPSLRDVRLAASSDTKQFTLQSLQARLPANTRIDISAKAPLNAQNKPSQLIASINARSDNPAAALSNDASAANKADPIAVNATATLTHQSLKIEPLQITQQGQTLNGSATYQPTAAVPLQLAVRGGALNLDSFTSGNTKSADKAETKSTSANDSILNRLKGFRAQFDVAIDRVITGGKNLRNVKAEGLFSDKGLDLQQAQANLEGLSLAAKGTIGKLSPLGDLNMNIEGQTANLSNTLQALGNPQARNLGATSFQGSVKGDLAKMAINMDAKLDQGSGKVNGSVLGLDNNKPGFDGTIALSHPETATIVRNFAKMNPGSALGAFALNATVTYAGETIKADNFSLKLGSAGGLNGSVNVTPKGQQKDINATIKADKLDLAALMGEAPSETNKAASNASSTANSGWSRDPVNLDMIRNLNGKVSVKIGELLYQKFVIKNFNNDLDFVNGSLKLNDLSATLFDAGRLVVNGTLTPAPQGQAHKGQFAVNIKDTDAVKFFNAMDSELFTKGTFSAEQQLSFSGASPYQIINSLSGDGQLKIRDAIANGIDLDALAEKFDRPNSLSDFGNILKQASAGGTTTIGDVDVPLSIRNGVATIAQTAVKTKLTETNFGGTADLPSKMVNMGGQIRFTDQKNMPPLGLKITGPFNAPRKEFDSQSVSNFFVQKGTDKLQEKAADKLDKLLGDKVPGLSGLLGGGAASKNAVETPTTNTTPQATPDAPVSKTPESAPVQNNVAPAPVPPVETPTPPTAPEAPTTQPLSKKEQQKQDLENAAGQLLQGILGGSR
jgi:uncharacterized protein involved in outer membrane biogenesis